MNRDAISRTSRIVAITRTSRFLGWSCYQWTFTVRIVDWPEVRFVAEATFPGSVPEGVNKPWRGPGSRPTTYGSEPWRAARDWTRRWIRRRCLWGGRGSPKQAERNTIRGTFVPNEHKTNDDRIFDRPAVNSSNDETALHRSPAIPIPFEIPAR